MHNSNEQIDDIEDDYCKHCDKEEGECECDIERCPDCNEELDYCTCTLCEVCQTFQVCGCN